MGNEWNVTVGIGDVDPEAVDLDRFTEWSGVLGAAPQGGLEVVLTILADGLRQAVATGLAIVEAAGYHPAAVDALTTGAFDYRSAVTATDTVGVPEAARILGVSSEAVRQRIATGSLPARKEGRDWRVPRPAIEPVMA